MTRGTCPTWGWHGRVPDDSDFIHRNQIDFTHCGRIKDDEIARRSLNERMISAWLPFFRTMGQGMVYRAVPMQTRDTGVLFTGKWSSSRDNRC